jgi:transcriptional regulator with PAS, ATPase and Fis domain
LVKEGKVSSSTDHQEIIQKIYRDINDDEKPSTSLQIAAKSSIQNENDYEIHSPGEFDEPEEYIEESLSLEEKEKEMIQKALEKYNGKRKDAAKELGISERTLYRKIKEFDLN